MADVEVHRHIRAQPQLVWELISDVEQMGRWSPETTQCTWDGDVDAPVVGATFRGENANAGRTWATSCRVISAVPGQRFAFDVKVGPAKIGRWEFDLVPADGGTRITESFTDQRGAVMRFLGAKLTQVDDRPAHNRTTMVTTLDRLAEAAEEMQGTTD